MRDRNSSRSCNGPFGLSCGGARLSLRSHAAKIEANRFRGRRRQFRKPIELVLPNWYQAMHPHALACRVRKAWP